MTEPLLPYYQRELLYVRQLAQEFAQKYPQVASRLMIEQAHSNDPHVERLLESFALLSGRLQHRLEDEFPEVADALLNCLYPHFLAPIPSMALIQLELDPARGKLPNGYLIPKGSRLQVRSEGSSPCKFCTSYPLTLWPIDLTNARLQSPPFPQGLAIPSGTAALLRLQLDCAGGMGFSDLTVDHLRFHLSGDPVLIPQLQELLLRETLQVLFRPVEPETQPVSFRLDPKICLKQVGFAEDEGLLPYPPHALPAYRLLTEFFTFPAKFSFLELHGLREVRRRGFKRSVEVILFLKESQKRLEQMVNSSTFLLGCTPVVNLFQQQAEPIATNTNRHPYRIIPDAIHTSEVEVYSVDSVTSSHPVTSSTTDYFPFHSIHHPPMAKGVPYWYISRRPPVKEGMQAGEVFLHMVNLGFQPSLPQDANLLLQVTCTNGDLPARLKQTSGLRFELEMASPLKKITCLGRPTVPLPAPHRRGRIWRLISHFNLNHLSLQGGEEALQAFKDMLKLYDFSDPGLGGQHLETDNRQLIEGIASLTARRVVGRTSAGFGRGVAVFLTLDEKKFQGTGAYLFASILERLFAHFVSANSFSQMTFTTVQRPDKPVLWPARNGELASS